MAAYAPPTFHAGDAFNFQTPEPGWVDWATLFGDGGIGAADVAANAAKHNTLSPLVVAFVHSDEPTLIQFGHSPSIHHGAGVFQDRMVGIIGDLDVSASSAALSARSL
mgnify:CR=1 FL=1